MRALLLFICVFASSNGHKPAFQTALTSENVCREKICKFKMVIRQEMSMTEKRNFGTGKTPITRPGETFLLDIGPEGDLIRRLGHYYAEDQEKYGNMSGKMVPVSENTITADGLRRPLVTINGVFPGPTFEVMEGAEIEVTLVNLMLHQSITMHWHGFHQKNTPWMDGVATVTQCGISPGSSFVYRFKASPSGTLWYHAHLGGLRADGAFGLFIVHKKEPEMVHYPLTLSHWHDVEFAQFHITNPYKKKLYGEIAGDGSHQYNHYPEDYQIHANEGKDGVPLSSMLHHSDLINGRGQYNDNQAPLAWFNVTSWDQEYLGFYIMNPGVEYSYNVSIDNHKMEIIGVGVEEVKPKLVDAVYINPGERTHVRVVLKKQETVVIQGEEYSRTPSNYWIRVITLHGNGTKGVNGVLHYPEAQTTSPASLPRVCTEEDPCVHYNCPYDYMEHPHIQCIGSHTLNSVSKEAAEYQASCEKVDMEVFLDFGFPIGSSVNGYRFVSPKNHMYSSEAVTKSCDIEECQDKPCYCTHIVDLPLKKCVQMVLSNYADPDRLHGKYHTIHMHGHDFVILKTGYPEYNKTSSLWDTPNSDLECPDKKMCRKMRWTKDQDDYQLDSNKYPVTDTVLVPFGGYAVVRVFTDNPGYWLMHCHQMMHAIEGMDVIVRVEPELAPKPPKNFPMNCGHFNFTHEEFEEYFAQSGIGSNQTSTSMKPQTTTKKSEGQPKTTTSNGISRKLPLDYIGITLVLLLRLLLD